mmetsp:Transcript_28084/g.59835  ORF Transcript_28084/g.59835 Transcript_28084/m.59835 type:complete len:179 (-) Transcript_28084:170-706(-)
MEMKSAVKKAPTKFKRDVICSSGILSEVACLRRREQGFHPKMALMTNNGKVRGNRYAAAADSSMMHEVRNSLTSKRTQVALVKNHFTLVDQANLSQLKTLMVCIKVSKSPATVKTMVELAPLLHIPYAITPTMRKARTIQNTAIIAAATPCTAQSPQVDNLVRYCPRGHFAQLRPRSP